MTASVAYIIFSAILALDPALAWSIIALAVGSGMRVLQWGGWLAWWGGKGTIQGVRAVNQLLCPDLAAGPVDPALEDSINAALKKKGWTRTSVGIVDGEGQLLYAWSAAPCEKEGEWSIMRCAPVTSSDNSNWNTILEKNPPP